MTSYLVHELWMITPNCEGVHAPSRLTLPYRMTDEQLRLFNINEMMVSLAPDGISNAKLLPVLCGPITGLPRLLVYRDNRQVENQTELLQ